MKPDCASVAAYALSLAMLSLAEASHHTGSPITLKAPSSEGQANQESEREQDRERERSLVSPSCPSHSSLGARRISEEAIPDSLSRHDMEKNQGTQPTARTKT